MNEYGLTLEDDYVVLKMITGEQLIAVKRAETKDYLTIEYPMLIKGYAFQNEDGMGEHVTASPYCKFSDDKTFTFDKQHIVFTKKMHTYAVPFYIGLVEEHEETVEVTEDEPPKTVEELGERVNKLAGFLRKMQQPEAEEPLSETSFIEGNDTKH
jgi:hypothetical protein